MILLLVALLAVGMIYSGAPEDGPFNPHLFYTGVGLLVVAVVAWVVLRVAGRDGDDDW